MSKNSVFDFIIFSTDLKSFFLVRQAQDQIQIKFLGVPDSRALVKAATEHQPLVEFGKQLVLSFNFFQKLGNHLKKFVIKIIFSN